MQPGSLFQQWRLTCVQQGFCLWSQYFEYELCPFKHLPLVFYAFLLAWPVCIGHSFTTLFQSCTDNPTSHTYKKPQIIYIHHVQSGLPLSIYLTYSKFSHIICMFWAHCMLKKSQQWRHFSWLCSRAELQLTMDGEVNSCSLIENYVCFSCMHQQPVLFEGRREV